MKRARMYDLSNPYGVYNDEVRVTADADALAMIATLDCVHDIAIFGHGKSGLVWLSPLYDVDDAWLMLMAALDAFTASEPFTLDAEVWER